MSWKKLLEDGSLQKKKISLKEIGKILTKAHESLRAAEVLIKQDFYDSAFKESYESMLLSGRTLIFSLGYKPRTVGSHAITVKFCQLYFGIDLKILTEKFDKMRRKRNYLIYGAGLTISKTEAENAIKTAKEFIKKIKKFIQKKNPQKKLI